MWCCLLFCLRGKIFGILNLHCKPCNAYLYPVQIIERHNIIQLVSHVSLAYSKDNTLDINQNPDIIQSSWCLACIFIVLTRRLCCPSCQTDVNRAAWLYFLILKSKTATVHIFLSISYHIQIFITSTRIFCPPCPKYFYLTMAL